MCHMDSFSPQGIVIITHNRIALQNALETVAFLRGLDKDDAIVQKLVDDMIKQENHFKLLPNITFINICKYSLIILDMYSQGNNYNYS